MARCDQCGATLNEGRWSGLCPRCMLLGALADADEPLESSTALDDLPSPPTTAPTRFGNYELLEEVAHGGMGVVYRARQVKLDREVAIKMLLLGQRASSELVERFKREAQAAARLHHPNIVPIHEVGEVDGQSFFSMDYIAGKNLAQILAGKPLPARDAARYVQAIAEAVHYAHGQGIIHRDLKPSNVLVESAEDTVHLTDFGLAKRVELESDLTLTGQVLGSPNHMAPELAAGQHARVGPPSDLYSLGAILYELLTGRPPFLAESVQETLVKIRDVEPMSPRLLNRRVPRDLETLCLKCLEKDPASRIATARELAEELGRYLEGEPIRTRPAGVLEKTWRWCRRKPVVAAMALALVSTVTMAFVGILSQWLRAEANALKETAQRQQAERERQRAEAWLYVAEMNLAAQAAERGDIGHATEILEQQVPAPNQTDRRGWEWRYLWGRCAGDEEYTFYAEPCHVNSVVFSSDGRLFATLMRAQKGIRVWDFKSGHLSASLDLQYDVSDVAVSQDNRFVVAAGWNDCVLLLDGSSLRQLGRLEHVTTGAGMVVCVDISADGRHVACGGQQATVVWDLPSTNIVAIIPRNDDWWSDPSFSPDGRLLAVVVEGRQVMLWDVEERRALRTVGERGTWLDLAFSPNGRRLAAAGLDGRVCLVDLDTSQCESWTNHVGIATSVAFSKDGNQLASLGNDGMLWVRDLRSKAEPRVYQGHRTEANGLAYSPDGQRLVTGSKDGTVRVWDPHAPPRHTRSITEIRTEGYPSLNGQYFASVQRESGVITLRELEFGRELRQIRRGPATPALNSALSPAGDLLVDTGTNGQCRIWDLHSGRLMRELAVSSQEVTTVEFSPDGSFLGTLSEDRVLRVWSVATWESVRDIRLADPSRDTPGTEVFGPSTRTAVMAFSRAGGWLAAGHMSAHLCVADLRGSQPFWMQEVAEDDVCALAFSPDERLLATGHLGDEVVVLREVATGRKVGTLRGGVQGGYQSIAFSPDGRRLAAASIGGDRASMWDLETQGVILEMPISHSWGLHTLNFEPSGHSLVGIGSSSLQIWHAPTLVEIDALKWRKRPQALASGF